MDDYIWWILGGACLAGLLMLAGGILLTFEVAVRVRDFWWGRYVGRFPLFPEGRRRKRKPRRPTLARPEPIADEPPVRQGEPATDLDLEPPPPKSGQTTTDWDVRGP